MRSRGGDVGDWFRFGVNIVYLFRSHKALICNVTPDCYFSSGIFLS